MRPLSEFEAELRRQHRRDRIAMVLGWLGLILAAALILAIAWAFIVVVFGFYCEMAP